MKSLADTKTGRSFERPGCASPCRWSARLSAALNPAAICLLALGQTTANRIRPTHTRAGPTSRAASAGDVAGGNDRSEGADHERSDKVEAMPTARTELRVYKKTPKRVAAGRVRVLARCLA